MTSSSLRCWVSADAMWGAADPHGPAACLLVSACPCLLCSKLPDLSEYLRGMVLEAHSMDALGGS